MGLTVCIIGTPKASVDYTVCGQNPQRDGKIHPASLGIAEHVAGLLAARGVTMGEEEPLRRGAAPEPAGPWWRRSADHWAAAAGS